MGAERWGREACRELGEGRVGCRHDAPRDAGGRGTGGAPRAWGAGAAALSFKRGRPPGGAGFPEAPPLAGRMRACPPVAGVGGRSLSPLALWGDGEGRGGRGPSAACCGPWRSPRSRSDPGENCRRRPRSRAELGGGSAGRVPLPPRRGAPAFVGTPARRYLGRPLPSPMAHGWGLRPGPAGTGVNTSDLGTSPLAGGCVPGCLGSGRA